MSYKINIAEKTQLDEQNNILQEISNKIAPIDLESIHVGILDFENDDVIITSGGLDSVKRRITT